MLVKMGQSLNFIITLYTVIFFTTEKTKKGNKKEQSFFFFNDIVFSCFDFLA